MKNAIETAIETATIALAGVAFIVAVVAAGAMSIYFIDVMAVLFDAMQNGVTELERGNAAMAFGFLAIAPAGIAFAGIIKALDVLFD
jgi:hypothetical protein